MDELIGYKIRKIKELKQFTQEYVSTQLGLSQAAYSSLESGRTKVDEDKLSKIAVILEVSPETIKNFNEQLIFNSCVQSGVANTYNINPLEELKLAYEKILIEKDERIKLLEKLIKK